MTVLPRGAKNRRSGRRPGWLLLTALLVLAILASATLVFTSRVELLRLAVILSLWAAVLAAFVSVIYRRQSQLDAAKARDMKYVYDLQLDREISARREYELSVEAHLRRQLAGELRAQAADEMGALRAELATLRASLQVLLGTDLSERAALELDRSTDAGVPEPLAMPSPPGRVQSSRVAPTDGPVRPDAGHLAGAGMTRVGVTRVEVTRVEVVDDVGAGTEQPIIDVPEEPLAPAGPPPPQWDAQPRPDAGYRGSHRRPDRGRSWTPPAGPPVAPPGPPPGPAPTSWRPPETRTRPGRHRNFEEQAAAGGPAAPAPAGPAGRHWNGPAGGSGNAVPGRHRNAEQDAPDEPEGQHAGGAPVADLMERLRSADGPGRRAGGGGRRRRED